MDLRLSGFVVEATLIVALGAADGWDPRVMEMVDRSQGLDVLLVGEQISYNVLNGVVSSLPFKVC